MLYARRRQFRPFGTFFLASFTGMMGVQFGTMLSGWMAKREIDKLPDSKRFIRLFKEARDEMINERLQRHHPGSPSSSSSGRLSGPDAILRGASIDRDETNQTMSFGSSNEAEPTRGHNEGDASAWNKIRTQNKPESTWDRIRAQQHRPGSSDQDSNKQDTYTAAWNGASASNRSISKSSSSDNEESFPRTREDFEQARRTTAARRNKYGDVIDE
ncbi:hypothetical protein BDF22DRAFT_698436 [Syncephalis plumigaleata]|nr:hypothetical protein BDF22DRAFT_698436 [Syncephalis plumigaleata]